MRKFLTLAVAAALITGAAFAQSPMNASSWAIRPNATATSNPLAANGTGFGVFAGAGGVGPTSTNNDDSCDIGVAPAATLLLPNFEVSVVQDRTQARDTLFSITNVSNRPQIAHVTIWTDRSFPVIDFNLFLTGYDVVPVSLYDIIVRGQIPPTSVTVTPGSLSLPNTGSPGAGSNPNWAASAVGNCTSLPGPIPSINADGTPVAGTLLADMQNALTVGTYGTLTGVGNSHAGLAVGYVTMDVANTCSTTLPTRAGYYTTEILYDNVFVGEYVRVNPTATTGNYAGGNPMVHIRAIPEGGPAGLPALGGSVNFPFTFYDRYTDHTTLALAKADRRMPLPGTFAARYIVGTPLNFGTDFAIWREGLVIGTANEAGGLVGNRDIPFRETVRFDESENPTTIVGGVCRISPCPVAPVLSLPETSTPSVNDAVFPADFAGTADAGGWVYMNLNNGGVAGYTARGVAGTHVGRSQNWVIVQMTSESRYGVDFDAAWLGNGCSADTAITGTTAATSTIGPAGGICSPTNPLCNTTP